MEKKNLAVRTMYAIVDYLVEESGVDACQLCCYFNADNQARESEKCPELECCIHRRKFGAVACRNGIIEKFQMKLTSEEK